MTNDLQKKDLKHIWHPCSQMKDYEDFPPIIIDRGEGVYLYDTDGNSYIDAISSWWTNLFGHANKRITEAATFQMQKLEHVIFANFSHSPAIELADKITALLPEKLQKVFFSDNGSSAIEVALKMSFQYHQQVGKSSKKLFVSVSDSYHGETIGALAVGDLELYSNIFKPLMMSTLRVEGCNCFQCPYAKTRNSCDAECFTKMKDLLENRHEEISAVIIEPMVQCAAGMKMYSPVYLKKLRNLCTEKSVHLIADEVAVGFGRTGKMFAFEHAGISPDFVCLSTGRLTAGFIPLSLTVTTDEIYSAFYDDYETQKAFLHSHSYSGNPVSCAIAVESLKIFEENKILEMNKPLSEFMHAFAIENLSGLKTFGEYRNIGMIGALELVDKSSGKSFDWKDRIGYKIYRKALQKGVLLRPLGNVIYFMPPYIIKENEIKKMILTARNSISEILE